MSESRTKILDAIECCRERNMCDSCPMQEEICDEMIVEMIKLPAELVDMIEKELAK